ncbi:MAG: outer membrane beta-barrel protein [Pseudobdellovibrionaceae bacterium]
MARPIIRLLILSTFCLGLAQTIGPQALAQDTADETYDPFSDYSEFEENAQEEADIHFFRNGRFVTMGLVAGPRSFTGNMGKVNGSAPMFGLFLSYFFDLRFALQFGFATGDHPFAVSGEAKTFTGNTTLSKNSFDLKYYFNTQNVTRGLASLNPYMLLGISNNTRTMTLSGVSGFARDSAMGFNFGLGIEIPMMRNKMFFGAQALYQYVNFKDENLELELGKPAVKTGVKPAGDILEIIGILGINF